MNTALKPQKVMRCEEEDCGQVYQMAGDVPIRLIRPQRVPLDGMKSSLGKCPLHREQKSGDSE